MPDPTAADYCRFAGSRLVEAREKFQTAVAMGYDDHIGEIAKVASLVWDAAIDILSALALLDREAVTGVSSRMRQYAKDKLQAIVNQSWTHLARLHNFQHKPNLTESEFRVELRYTGLMLEIFNLQLPQSMQIAGDNLAWLSANPPQPNA